jgi:hypothetical protein
MAKRARGHSVRRLPSRSARPPGGPDSESTPTAGVVRATTGRWWKRITQGILTAGALAGAIAAVVALLPERNPDPEDNGQFTEVRVTSQVPMSEYQQRSATMLPQESGGNEGGQPGTGGTTPIAQLALILDVKSSSSAGLIASVPRQEAGPTTSLPPSSGTSAPDTSSSDTGASSSTTTSSTTTSSTTTSSTTTPPSETSSTSTSAPSTGSLPSTADLGVLSPDVRLVLPRQFQDVDLGAYADDVLAVVDARDPEILGDCDDPDVDCRVTVLPMIVAEPVSPEGTVVPPEVAAERVLEVLRDTRRTGTDQPGREEPGAGELGGERSDAGEPLGVVVSTDVALVGLRDRPVLVSWSMWQASGDQRLFGEWLNETLAYRLEATTDHDVATLDLWIPLPKEPGSYFIRLQLTADEFRLDSADSEAFE